ncbi:hypothetical protein BJF85_23080 [Saccharomonospora sp. CUA-673]|nr:hypothetical protein BJF85_23080 [Saccharomonospora sp. CUA-673]
MNIETSDDSGLINTGAIAENTPVVGSGVDLVSKFCEGPGEDAFEAANWTKTLAIDSAAFISEVGGLAGEIAEDPLGWLIGEGLDFLLSVIQPLDDMLKAVTGDGPALEQAAGNFGQIGQAFQSMSEDFPSVSNEALGSWQGDSADAAGRRLAAFADGIAGVASKAGNVAEVLQQSAMVMQVIEEVIKAIITEFVKWLILTWVPALLAAGPTFGGSTAAAGTATGVKATTTVADTSQKVSKLQQLLGKIKDWFAKIKSSFQSLGSSQGLKDAAGKALEKGGFTEGMTTGDTWKQIGTEVLKEGANETVKQTTGIDVKEGGDILESDVSKIPGFVKTLNDHEQDQISNAKDQAEYQNVGEEQSDSRIRGNLDF